MPGKGQSSLCCHRYPGAFTVKRPYQPNRRHRKKTHGFRVRMQTAEGQNVIQRRRQKGRWKLSVSVAKGLKY